MTDVDQILRNARELEERFLDKAVDTGDPADDVDTGPMGDAPEYDEFEASVTVAGNSAVSCMVAIEQILRRGNKEKLIKYFGEDAEALLRQTQECLQGIADLFDADEDSEEETEEEPEDEEVQEEQPKEAEKNPEDK